MMLMQLPNFITSPWRPTPVTRFCSIFNQLLQLISAHRVSGRRSGDPGGAACARLYVLGPIRGDAVRPTRARAFAARDLRRLGELRGQAGASRGGGAASIDPRVRQCASAVAALSNGVLSGPGAVSRGRRARRPFRFKNKLLSLDATVIDLCAEMFPWAVFRRTKGAVKLHFTLDHDGYLPTFLVITDGKHHEGPMAREQTVSARDDPGRSTRATSTSRGSRT